jgi:hypothetical protein
MDTFSLPKDVLAARYYLRWASNLNLKEYGFFLPPIPLAHYIPKNMPEDQYVLRMMVATPQSDTLFLPQGLEWLREAIALCRLLQGPFGSKRFIYITVRIGQVRSTTDDEWHVDGFSMRTPHVPEQNYVWADSEPTEYLEQPFQIPSDFDPLKHNIHRFFQLQADQSKIRTLPLKCLNLLDPYMVHRRPPGSSGLAMRKMFRISFVPIEIEDDTCQQNPLLPSGPYNREDIRNRLTDYVT